MVASSPALPPAPLTTAGEIRTKIVRKLARIRIVLIRWREEREKARDARMKALAEVGKHPLQQLRLDPNFPCPACGHRDGEIRWASALKWTNGSVGAVVHQCHVCKAAWGEAPIFKASDWHIALTDAEARMFERKDAAVEIAKNA